MGSMGAIAADERWRSFATLISELPLMRETARQREAFQIYLEMGRDRSLSRLHEELLRTYGKPKTVRTVEEWSSKLGWQARIDQLEREAQVAAQAAFVAEKREANRRHAREAQALQQLGLQALADVDLEDVTPATATRLVEIGIRLEREARGLGREEIVPAEGEIVEVHLVMGGPKELFMFPDPDQDPAEIAS